MCFFFQAENGIRDYKVTGVQTCALPIWMLDRPGRRFYRPLTKMPLAGQTDRKSTRLNSSHLVISYAVFCLKKLNSSARAVVPADLQQVVPVDYRALIDAGAAMQLKQQLMPDNVFFF